MNKRGGRSERVVSAYLGGLVGFALLTAISPLFFFSWPYLAMTAVPTIRWFRRRRVPIGRVMMRWIVGVAGLMMWLPLGIAVVYVAEGHSGAPETWVLVGIGVVFVPFVLAARQCLRPASSQLAVDGTSRWTTPSPSGSLRPMSASGDQQHTVSVGEPAGALITFGPALPRAVDEYDFVDVWVSVEGPGLNARSVVRTMEGTGAPYCLSGFLSELADDWKGSVPRSEFEAIEHQLSIVATRDLHGHVVMRLTLRESYRADSWEVSATAVLDAGEEMAAVARDVKALLA